MGLRTVHIETWQRNLGALWCANAFTMTGYNFFLPFFPLYLQTLGVESVADSVRWAGVITSTAAVSMVIGNPLVGNIADRWGRKTILVLWGIGTALAITAMAFVTSPEQLVGVRLFQGLMMATGGAASAIVAQSTPKTHLTFALGLMMTAQLVGTTIGPTVGGLLAGGPGLRFSFIAAGIMSFSSAAITMFLVHDDFVPAPRTEARESVLHKNLAIIAVALFPTLVLLAFLTQFANVVVQPMLAIFVGELNGGENSAAAAGLVFGAFGLAIGLSAVIAGRISDRIGHGRVLRVCLAGAAITCVPQVFVQDVWQLLVLRVILGVFLGGMKPTVSSMVAQLVPKDRHGAAFGLTSAGFALANMIGPMVGAWTAGGIGSRSVFAFTAATLGLGWVVVSVQLSRHAATLPAHPTLETNVQS